jgi:NADH-quinone oxidoreductase subunit L
VLGIGLIVAFFGSLDYATVFAAAPQAAGATLNLVGDRQWSVLTAICIGLFVGAMGKSAQVPCMCGCRTRWKARHRSRR